LSLEDVFELAGVSALKKNIVSVQQHTLGGGVHGPGQGRQGAWWRGLGDGALHVLPQQASPQGGGVAIEDHAIGRQIFT